MNVNHRINRQIRAKKVRVIGAEGENLGVKHIREASELASQAGMDLVEISPNTDPPVCRIVDYGKWQYESKKKDREHRKPVTKLKEVKFSVRIGDGDYQTKVRRAQEFLKEGHKVKLSLHLRGREMAHPELGLELITRAADACQESGRTQGPINRAGNSVSVVLNPAAK